MQLRKKSTFERQQDLLDELAHLVEDSNNRLTLESSNIAQGYIEGRINLYLEVRSRNTGCDFHIVLGRLRRKSGLGYPVGQIDSRFAANLIIEPCCEKSRRLTDIETEDDSCVISSNFEAGRFRVVGLNEIAVCVHGQVPPGSGADRQYGALVSDNA